MKKAIYVIIAGVALFLSSCSPKFTRLEQYPGMYEAKPVTLVVMPPINNTSNVDAKELLYTSISYPLIEAGYYVISPHLTMEMLKAESGYDAEMLIERDAAIFAQVFGADAVVFSVIDEWAKKGFGIQTKLHYIIKSTKDNSILFERTCDLYLDLSSNSGSSSNGGLLGALAGLDVGNDLLGFFLHVAHGDADENRPHQNADEVGVGDSGNGVRHHVRHERGEYLTDALGRLKVSGLNTGKREGNREQVASEDGHDSCDEGRNEVERDNRAHVARTFRVCECADYQEEYEQRCDCLQGGYEQRAEERDDARQD